MELEMRRSKYTKTRKHKLVEARRHSEDGVQEVGWRVVCRKPPVGFEPTTSRLLSGCSAN